MSSRTHAMRLRQSTLRTRTSGKFRDLNASPDIEPFSFPRHLLDDTWHERFLTQLRTHVPVSAEPFSTNVRVASVHDLLTIIDEFRKYQAQYIDIHLTQNERFYRLERISRELGELDRMVGMRDLKRQVAMQLIHHLMNDRVRDDDPTLRNVAILGPPGVGKTSVSKMLASIYAKIGLVDDPTVRFASRSDLVGRFCGETAIKTGAFLSKCRNGVLVIDEAYSLGCASTNVDTFSKECVDTLTKFLSETPTCICIIMGYERDMETSLFGLNEGLTRRFPYIFRVSAYTPAELASIALLKCKERGQRVDERAVRAIVEHAVSTRALGQNNGGDADILVERAMMSRDVRAFSGICPRSPCLEACDFEDAISSMTAHQIGRDEPPPGMYV